MAIGLAAVTSLTGILTWATTRIGPAPRVAVTLIGSDYRDALNLPPNGYGDRAVGQLAAWVSGTDIGSRRHLELTQPPIEWSSGADFKLINSSPDAAVSLTFISAHGVGTANGPALLTADAKRPAQTAPISDLIATLRQLPERQQKILVLDCVHFMSHPAIGVVLNDFARQLRLLDAEVRAVPNLVVLVSSDVGQQTWIDPAAGTTHFANALLKALNGEAEDLDGDGWVDLLEVHHAASMETSNRVGEVCGQSQTPWLLPLGEKGVERSRNLGLFPFKTEPVVIPSLIEPTRGDRLRHWWRLHDAFQTYPQMASIVSPVAWRRFEATLLRFEHFELAGCRDAANAVENNLASLCRQLEQPTSFDSLACRSGLISPEIIGFRVSTELQARVSELVSLLQEMNPVDAANHWSGVVASQPNAQSVAYLRRTIIECEIRPLIQKLRDQAVVERPKLTRAADLVRAITDPMNPIPQTGLVLMLLDRDLPVETLGSQDATRIARFLELVLHSDRVSMDRSWWAARTYEWVDDEIRRADRARRLAGDLLFGEPDARGRADRYLTEAEMGYAEVERIVEIVAEAETIRMNAPMELAHLRELLSARTVPAPDSTVSREVDSLERIQKMLDTITALLERPVPVSPEDRKRALEQLANYVDQYRASMVYLQQDVAAQQLASLSSATERLPRTSAALRSPGGTSEVRLAAWQRVRRMASAPRPTAGSSSIAVTDQQIKLGAALRGRLALAAWPQRIFNAFEGHDLETRGQVEHRLKVFAGETDWWQSLNEAALQTSRRELAAWDQLVSSKHGGPQNASSLRTSNKEVSSREVPGTGSLQGSLGQESLEPRTLELLARMTLIPPLESIPIVIEDRRVRFAKFLAWQRNRFLLDAYSSFEPEAPPYYDRACQVLSSDIVEQRTERGVELRDAASVGQSLVELDVAQKLTWTTQLNDQFPIRTTTPHSYLEGYVTLWVEAEGRVAALQPAEGKRVVRPLSHGQSAPGVVGSSDSSSSSDPAEINELWVSAGRLDSSEKVLDQASSINVHGYFRGRLLQRRVDVRMTEIPDVHIVAPPRPSGGKIAIRSDSAALQSIGSAVTLVLDCSGSMGAPRGRAFDEQAKYAHAVAAVESLLDEMPSGVTLSVWAFGQAIGEAKTARPVERSIRQIQPPLVWDSHDLSLRESLVNAIRYPSLEPWNESPLIAAMFAASDDLRDRDGIRSLVVVTDGADNRIAHDPVTNPLGLSAERLLEKHFRGTGITVNVIAFHTESSERSEMRKQLACVERMLPAGRFVEADQVTELATALRDMLLIGPNREIRVAQHHTPSSGINAEGVTLLNSAAATIPISPSTGPAHWTPLLPSGLYRVLQTDDRSSLVQLRDGDRLMLGGSPSGTFFTWSNMDRELRWSPRRDLGRWRVALLPVPRSETSVLARSLVLESDSTDGTLAVDRPADLWVEATRGTTLLPIRWQPNHTRPGAVIEIEAHGGTEADTVFRIWLSDQQGTPVGTLIRNRDFVGLSDLAPAVWNMSGGQVRLDSARLETHVVPDQHGSVSPQACLVLRGSCPPGTRYRMRTKGLVVDGQDEQCFIQLGQFTLRQWPISEADAERSLTRVELISVEQLQLDTERAGTEVLFQPLLQRSADSNTMTPEGKSTR